MRTQFLERYYHYLLGWDSQEYSYSTIMLKNMLVVFDEQEMFHFVNISLLIYIIRGNPRACFQKIKFANIINKRYCLLFSQNVLVKDITVVIFCQIVFLSERGDLPTSSELRNLQYSNVRCFFIFLISFSFLFYFVIDQTQVNKTFKGTCSQLEKSVSYRLRVWKKSSGSFMVVSYFHNAKLTK